METGREIDWDEFAGDETLKRAFVRSTEVIGRGDEAPLNRTSKSAPGHLALPTRPRRRKTQPVLPDARPSTEFQTALLTHCRLYRTLYIL